MMRLRQAVPLLVGLAIAVAVAIGARLFISTGIPEQVTIAVAAIPLHPGETFTADHAVLMTAYDSPAIRGMIREEDLPRFTGGTVLMFVPAGAAIPQTAVRPPGQLTATARLAALEGEDELLLVLPASDRLVAPPFSRLRPGDCLDLVAFFEAPAGTIPMEAAAVEELTPAAPSARATPAPGEEITATMGITRPVRPLAKWLVRAVVRSVLGLPPPARETAGTTAVAGEASAGAPRLLVAIPRAAVEGVVYGLEASRQVYLVLAPPCARAMIPPSAGFSDRDLEDWVQAGRAQAGPPRFFLDLAAGPEAAPPTPAPEPTPASEGKP